MRMKIIKIESHFIAQEYSIEADHPNLMAHYLSTYSIQLRVYFV